MATAAVLAATPGLAQNTVEVVPSQSSVLVGEAATLDVTIEGFVGEVGVYAFQFDLDYDPAILAIELVEEGPLLAAGGFKTFLPGEVDGEAGALTFVAGTLLGREILDVPTGGTAATVHLRGLSPGTSAIDISNVVVLSFDLEELSTDDVGTSIEVVPEPGRTLLEAASLLTLLGVARWRRRSIRLTS